MIRMLSAAIFAAALAFVTLRFYEKNKTGKGRKALACIVCGILLFAGEVWLPVAVSFVLFGCAVAYAMIFEKMKTTAALFSSALVAAAFTVIRAMINLLFNGIFGGDLTSDLLTVMGDILCVSLYLMTVYVLSRFFEREQEQRAVSLALLILPLATGATALSFAYINKQYPMPDAAGYACALCCIVLLLSDIAAFYIHEKSVRLRTEAEDIRKENLRLQNREDYYAALKKQSEDAHVLMHDINRHLNTLGHISENNEDVADYLSAISDDFSVNNPVDYCGDPTLNLIVHRFYERCRSGGIRFDVNIREAQIDFMTAPDITALFDNLLENAYEAAAVSHDKMIELNICMRNKSFTMIQVANSCDITPTTENGELITRKGTPYHGIGTKSIRRIVKKYDGDLKWQYREKERVFETTIMLRLLSM